MNGTSHKGFLPYQPVREIFKEIGAIASFSTTVTRQLFKRPLELPELLRQSYYLGYKALPLVLITGFILGMVLTIQMRPLLVDFGAESELPGLVTISIVREIGPVIIALICAGKIASGIGAELGSMRVTEQIDAMEVSGTNPLKFLVATRVLSTTFMVPLLVIVADFISLIGSYTAMNIHSNISLSLYLSLSFDDLTFLDVIPATVKTVVFGFIIGIVGSYKGYHAEMGTESVGIAANSAVVTASLSIFVIDLLAVQITDLISIL
ncbi:MAG: ABC transporter permease [Bacteroidales bacterium]|nr:ABC transporter permease [Bacteroidales bacterium]